jgi:DNA modification methylase
MAGAEECLMAPEPYYDRDGITIYCGDAREILPLLADETFDLVVTSPPYNMGLVPGGNGRGMYRPGASNKAGRFRDGYGLHDDAMEQADYDAWQRGMLAECWRLISERGAIFYNHRSRVEHGRLRFPLGLDFGLPLRQMIVWDRGTGIDVNLRNFCTAHELIFLFAKPDFRLVDHSASGMSDVWRLGMEYRETGHPAPFPVSLPQRAIAASGAASVLDPFAGSGSTLRAAANLGIRAVGIELEERYCSVAVRRLQQSVLPLEVPA